MEELTSGISAQHASKSAQLKLGTDPSVLPLTPACSPENQAAHMHGAAALSVYKATARKQPTGQALNPICMKEFHGRKSCCGGRVMEVSLSIPLSDFPSFTGLLPAPSVCKQRKSEVLQSPPPPQKRTKYSSQPGSRCSMQLRGPEPSLGRRCTARVRPSVAEAEGVRDHVHQV